MTKEEKTLCAYCKRELNVKVEPTTDCALCGKTFCCTLSTHCATKYHDENECNGSFVSILNPKWRMKLHKLKDR